MATTKALDLAVSEDDNESVATRDTVGGEEVDIVDERGDSSPPIEHKSTIRSRKEKRVHGEAGKTRIHSDRHSPGIKLLKPPQRERYIKAFISECFQACIQGPHGDLETTGPQKNSAIILFKYQKKGRGNNSVASKEFPDIPLQKKTNTNAFLNALEQEDDEEKKKAKKEGLRVPDMKSIINRLLDRVESPLRVTLVNLCKNQELNYYEGEMRIERSANPQAALHPTASLKRPRMENFSTQADLPPGQTELFWQPRSKRKLSEVSSSTSMNQMRRKKSDSSSILNMEDLIGSPAPIVPLQQLEPTDPEVESVYIYNDHNQLVQSGALESSPNSGTREFDLNGKFGTWFFRFLARKVNIRFSQMQMFLSEGKEEYRKQSWGQRLSPANEWSVQNRNSYSSELDPAICQDVKSTLLEQFKEFRCILKEDLSLYRQELSKLKN
mmetsp:Transcript_19504/g.38174  ORF Transcript_19504/g.38174 Transcript_19504/m.38174 type:complete len:440 (+) Transcript_19504:174-1493(+)